MCYYTWPVLIIPVLSFTGIDDHFEVKTSLENLDPNQLRDLGGALGLRYPKLRRMTNNIILDDMTAAWLNKEDSVLHKSGEPTWSRLVKGLEEIGQMGVAEDIQNEKCSSEIGQELMKGLNYLP